MIVDYLIVLIGAIVFIGCGVWHIVAIYMARTMTTAILVSLPNSRSICAKAPHRCFGLWGEVAWINDLAKIMTFPRGSIARGELSQEDLASFPPSIRARLIGMFISLWTMGGLGLVGCVLTQFVS